MDKQREKQLNDDYWQKINEDFERLAENERYIQQKLKYEKEFGQEDEFIEEQDEQNRLLREKQLNDDYWQKLNDDFERLAENERYMQQKIKYEKEQKKFKEALEKQKAQLEEQNMQLEQKDVQLEQKDITISKLQQTQQNAYQELLKKGLTLEEISEIFSVDVETIQNTINE